MAWRSAGLSTFAFLCVRAALNVVKKFLDQRQVLYADALTPELNSNGARIRRGIQRVLEQLPNHHLLRHSLAVDVRRSEASFSSVITREDQAQLTELRTRAHRMATLPTPHCVVGRKFRAAKRVGAQNRVVADQAACPLPRCA